LAIKCPKCNVANPDTVKFCGKCGTQLPSPKDVHPQATETLQSLIKELTTGATFAGHYQIVEELGKGRGRRELNRMAMLEPLPNGVS